MSFKEVTALRKSGELDAALEMAREDYEFSGDNYSSSALFWTLRIFCERCLNEGKSEDALNFYNEMVEVYQLMDDGDGIGKKILQSLEAKVSPEFSRIAELLIEAKSGNTKHPFDYVSGLDCSAFPEKVVENISWIMYYHFKAIHSESTSNEFKDITRKYIEKGLPRPSMAHSNIINLAVKFAGTHPDFDLMQFICECGVENFSEDDFSSDPDFAGGLSLVSRAARRCFLNRSITLKQVLNLFGEIMEEKAIAELLSSSYVSILYKDSAEQKDKRKFLADAQEYISRIEGVCVKNKHHSKILESVLWELEKGHDSWYRNFFEEWGLGDSLTEEDWKESANGNMKLMSLAEKAIIRYGDALAQEHLAASDYKNLLIKAVERLPESENMPRRLSRVLFEEGKVDEAIEITKNLIKSRVGKFYFWFDLAEYVDKKDEDELCAACCAKALLATNEEKFIGKVHLVFSHILARKKMFSEALYEAQVYRKTCEENGWPVKKAYEDVRNLIPQGVVASDSNVQLYRQFEQVADAFVYSDLESHSMVMVDYKFEEKSDGKKKLVYYLYDCNNDFLKINPNAYGLDRKAKPMTCYEVKYLESDGKRRPILVRQIDAVPVLSYKQAVVDNINKDKGVIHVIGIGFDMTIPMERIKFKYGLGDVLDIAFKTKSKDGHKIHMFIHARKSEQPCNLTTEFSGVLTKKENDKGPFGFVNDIYIPCKFIDGFKDGDMVKGLGIISDGRMKVLRLKQIAESM